MTAGRVQVNVMRGAVVGKAACAQPLINEDGEANRETKPLKTRTTSPKTQTDEQRNLPNMSIFDPEAFLNTEIKGAIDTTIIPVPIGEFTGTVVRPAKAREIDTKDGRRVVLDITWGIDDEGVKKTTGLDRPTSRQSVFLDMTEDGTALDMSKGKNRQLGLLRAAVGQNTNRNWAPAMLEGGVAKVNVEHSANPNDPESPYANVTRATSLT